MDRARRPVPLTDAEAGEMLDRFRAGERLVDPRPPADRAGARAVIVRVGRFAERLPGVELDINPLVMGAAGGAYRRRDDSLRHLRVLPGLQPAQRARRHPQRLQPGTLENTAAIATGAVVVLLVLVVEMDILHGFFTTTDLTSGQWLVCAAIGSAIVWTGEVLKIAAGPCPPG